MYDDHNRKLLTADEAGAILGVTGGTVRHYARAGLLTPVRRLGKLQLFDRAEIEVFERPPRGRPRRDTQAAS